MLLGEAGQAVATIMLSKAIQRLIDNINEYDMNSTETIWQSIHGSFLFFVYVVVAIFVFSRISGVLTCFISPRIRLVPRRYLFKHLLKHDLNYFNNHFSGALGAKVNEVSTAVAQGLWSIIFDVFPLIILFSVTIYMFFTTHILLGFLITSWVVLYSIIGIYLSIKQFYISENLANARSKISGGIIDTTISMCSVILHAHGKYETELLNKNMQEEVIHSYKNEFWREVINWKHFGLSLPLLIGAMYMSVGFFERGELTIGQLAFVFTLTMLVTREARGLNYNFRQFLTYIGQLSDGVKTIMQRQQVADKPDALDLRLNRADIEFKDLNFSYPGSSDQMIFDYFNLKIEAGEKIGLAGLSGAGKSTLINLLLRFYDINHGSIMVDGQNIADVTQISLRQKIAIIPQDTSLFHRSLLENIGYGDLNATKDQIITAAQKAHAHEFIVLNNGEIAEQGTHADLLKNQDGLYKKLWEHQSGGFIGQF